MKKSVKYSLIAFIAFDVLAAALICAYLFLVKNYWESPNSYAKTQVELLIEKGDSFNQIIEQLADASVIDKPSLFKIFAYANKHHNKYLAGYYQFDAHLSPKKVSEKLVNGDVATFDITFPEGFLSEQIVQILQNEKHLSGEIAEIPSEGSLLPETYHFNHGELRKHIIKKMQQLMANKLDEAWQNRNPNLPYKNKEEAMIMASIIEKETGITSERTKVAAVFVNRLRKGMKLQSDPTANYGIYKEVGELKKELNGTDINHYSVYNTYVINGLPATPICNFGEDSLNAAFNPAQIDDLYFVANGEGGHNFARTLSEHNRNVAKYRQKRSKQHD
jgi:UPF0755 protein